MVSQLRVRRAVTPGSIISDTVCKLCACQNVLDVDVSEASQTSSSTEEDLNQ